MINRGVSGCQRDHYHFSVAVNGIFWYDPALFPAIYRLFRSKVFGMDHGQAMEMMAACFARESEGLAASAKTHRTASESYKHFVEPVTHLERANRDMAHMSANSERLWLARNRRALARFRPAPGREH